MSMHLPLPPAVDLLTQAIDHMRRHLDRSLPVAERARNFWAIAVAVRDLGACDVVAQDLTDLADKTGLTIDLGPAGKTDAAHLIRWALISRNPF